MEVEQLPTAQIQTSTNEELMAPQLDDPRPGPIAVNAVHEVADPEKPDEEMTHEHEPAPEEELAPEQPDGDPALEDQGKVSKSAVSQITTLQINRMMQTFQQDKEQRLRLMNQLSSDEKRGGESYVHDASYQNDELANALASIQKQSYKQNDMEMSEPENEVLPHMRIQKQKTAEFIRPASQEDVTSKINSSEKKSSMELRSSHLKNNEEIDLSAVYNLREKGQSMSGVKGVEQAKQIA